MADVSVAVAMYYRNANLNFIPANNDSLSKSRSFFDIFGPFPSSELCTAIGLAFTAVITDGKNVKLCRSALETFLKYQHAEDPVYIRDVVTSISILFESGFSAFNRLGYPYYYDDFLSAYHYVLTQSYNVPIAIRKEMKRILSLVF